MIYFEEDVANVILCMSVWVMSFTSGLGNLFLIGFRLSSELKTTCMCIKELCCDNHPHPPLSWVFSIPWRNWKGALGSGQNCSAELCSCFEFCPSFVLWRWCVISLMASLAELSPWPICCSQKHLPQYRRKTNMKHFPKLNFKTELHCVTALLYIQVAYIHYFFVI